MQYMCCTVQPTSTGLLQGKVVEEGSHFQLLARGGKYSELWSRQASVDDFAEPADEPPGHHTEAADSVWPAEDIAGMHSRDAAGHEHSHDQGKERESQGSDSGSENARTR